VVLTKVLGKRILVERLDDKPLASAVIEVVHLDERPSQFAKVRALGTLVNELVSVGDTVVTKQYCGTPVTIEGEDLFLVMEDDILAVYGTE